MKASEHLRIAAPADSSDAALLLRAGAGDESAFRSLVQRHEVAIRRFAAAMLDDAPAGREVAQEAFASLWARRARWHAGTDVRALLYVMARNRCRSLLRRRAVLRFVGLGEAPAATDLGSDAIAAERRLLVRRALAALPEKFRAPLVLRFVEDLDYDAIAAAIGRTPSAARSRVHYGLKALAAELPEEVRP